MEVYVSIDGVLRNLIQKVKYHYEDCYLNSDVEPVNQKDIDEDVEETDTPVERFQYDIIGPIKNDDLMNYFKFQSKEEFETFLYMEYALEIFGHSGLSSSTAVSDLNKIIFLNKEHNFTLVGLNEYGKASPSTLFFLSKQGFLGRNIKFITSNEIESEWKKCDVWITDNMEILSKKPKRKKGYQVINEYTSDIVTKKTINKLTDIKEKWLHSSENNTI